MKLYNFNIIDYVTESAPLARGEEFCFDCNNDCKCFGDCCRKSHVFLTPFDIIMMKKQLGISSSEFLEKYTAMPSSSEFPFPALMLRNENEQCLMIDGDDCSVYESRPLACRLYPLAIPPNESRFHLMTDDFCEGHLSRIAHSPEEWVERNKAAKYIEFHNRFIQIISDSRFEDGTIEPVKLEMFYMASYDIDRFRDFVFDSIFLQRVQADEDEILEYRTNDEKLLEYAMKWIEKELLGILPNEKKEIA